MIAAGQSEIDEQFFAIVTDLVGAPTELLSDDGAVAGQARRSLWGRTTWTGASTPLLFPGQYLDDETGLAYNLHRYYDPDTARYVSQDPLGLAPAPNPAAYVHNPHTWADPIGLNPCGPQPPKPSGSTSPTGRSQAGPSTAGTGRLPNRLAPIDGKHAGVNGLNDPAPGDHTVFRRSDSTPTDIGTGRVEHYQTYNVEPRAREGWRPGARFRGVGGEHGGIQPPIYYPSGKGKAMSAAGTPHLPLGY